MCILVIEIKEFGTNKIYKEYKRIPTTIPISDKIKPEERKNWRIWYLNFFF